MSYLHIVLPQKFSDQKWTQTPDQAICSSWRTNQLTTPADAG